MSRKLLFFALFILGSVVAEAQRNEIKIARLQYRGGGDWYNDPSSLTNMINFSKSHVPLLVQSEYDDVPLGSRDLFNYPFAFLTGHGNIELNSVERDNIRAYLEAGGFLYMDDDYGMDEAARAFISKLFPDKKMVELPFNHPIYSSVFNFPNGLPKIHEHDGKPPQGFGIFHEGKLVLYYTFETNPADGWADAEIHNVPPKTREKSLQIGTNILFYALTQP